MRTDAPYVRLGACRLPWSKHVRLFHAVAISALVALPIPSAFVVSSVTHAGPCTGQIAQLLKIAQSDSPTLPQMRSAQLHHEPTLKAVNDAENEAKTEAAAAFARAQAADAKHDATACTKAVAKLKLCRWLMGGKPRGAVRRGGGVFRSMTPKILNGRRRHNRIIDRAADGAELGMSRVPT